MTDNLTKQLHAELAPSNEALERIHAHLSIEIERDAPAPTSVPRPRRRPAIRCGLAVSGATVVAAAIALSPFDPSGSSRGPATATAAAAFERAADSAGTAVWAPLVPDEYHHTMTTSFLPQIPAVDGDTDRLNEQPAATLESDEVFLDVNGRGMRIQVRGGTGDPNSYVTPGKPNKAGWILGFGYPAGHDNARTGSLADSLHFADFVEVTAWRRATTVPERRLWYRTATGFQTGAPLPASAIARPGLTLGQRFQRDHWGAPIKVINRLNSADPADLDKLLDPLLAELPDGEISVVGPLPQGDYDETTRWFTAQVQAQHAVKLLGSAPLAPEVRRALFQRLADQTHARVERGVADELGRTGTRVTIDWRLDEHIPAFTVTLDELRRDAEAHHQPANGAVKDPGPIKVEAHRSIGRWYQTIVFDERTGALLQDEVYADWKTTTSVPRFAEPRMWSSSSRPARGVQWDPGYYGTLDGTIFNTREPARDLTTVLSTACEITPRMCQ